MHVKLKSVSKGSGPAMRTGTSGRSPRPMFEFRVNRIANRDGDAVISSCASRDGQIAMILAIRLVILGLF